MLNWIIIILFTLSLNSDQYFKYCQRSIKLKRITRGNYKNVLSYEEAPLLTSRAQNSYLGINGIPFRNQIYPSGQIYQGTQFAIGYSMIIELRQVFELNTLVLMLRNGDVRTYDFVVYASDSNQETVIQLIQKLILIKDIQQNFGKIKNFQHIMIKQDMRY